MPSTIIKADNNRELEEAVRDYMERYPPQGYGTFVKERYTETDGTLCAVIWRGTTAD